MARLRRAAGFVWQGSRDWTILNAILVFIQGVLPLAALYLMKLVIDAITAAHLHPSRLVSVWPHVAVLVTLTALVTLAGALVRSLSTYGRAGASRECHRPDAGYNSCEVRGAGP